MVVGSGAAVTAGGFVAQASASATSARDRRAREPWQHIRDLGPIVRSAAPGLTCADAVCQAYYVVEEGGACFVQGQNIHDPAVDQMFLQTGNPELLVIDAGTGELVATTPIAPGFLNPVLVP